MNINKKDAVALFVALDFPKAADWDNTKLIERLGQLPAKLTNDQVPKEFSVLFNSIQVAVKTKDPILVDVPAGEKPAATKAAAPAAGKPEKKPEAKPVAKAKDAPKGKSEAVAGKKPAKASEAATSPVKEKVKSKKSKPAPKPEIEKDKFGAAKNSMRSAIYAALSKDWQSEDEVAKIAGVDGAQARRRLRHSVSTQPDLFEKRTRVEYRLKQPAKK